MLKSILQEIEEYAEVSIQSEKITEIQHTLFFGSDCFLWKIKHCLNEVKTKFCHEMPTKPFRIMIIPANSLDGNEEENEDEEEEDEEEAREEEREEEEEQIINTEKTFKSDECVICLTNSPNVLFCNCGHLSLCVECDKEKSLNTCPVCKTENTI